MPVAQARHRGHSANGIIVTVIDLLLGLGISPGMFVGWSVYLIIAEEIQWRIHMNGCLPVSVFPAHITWAITIFPLPDVTSFSRSSTYYLETSGAAP
jgi:hypothetical protein